LKSSIEENIIKPDYFTTNEIISAKYMKKQIMIYSTTNGMNVRRTTRRKNVKISRKIEAK